MVGDGYKDTEIGVIPVEWEVVKLGDFCDILDNKRVPLSSEERANIKGDVPYYGANGVVDYINDFLFDEELVLLAEDGGNFSEYETRPIAYMIDGKSWVNNHTHILRAKNSQNHFLFYNLVHKNIMAFINGGTRAKLNRGELVKIQIPLPPLKEQEKIADILSTADNKIDAIASQIKMCETVKKGLLQKLLSEGIGHSEFKDSELGKIPLGWEVVELEKLLTFKNGVNASKEQYGKGYRFINVLDIINNLTIKHDDIIGLVDITDKEFELYEVKYGNILFQRSSETREEVGQSNVYLDKEQSATFGGFVIKGSAKQEYNPVFMNYLFKIPAIRKQITSRSGGSTRYNIGQNSLNQVVVQFPPLQEQKQIADILSTADEKLEILRAKKQKYETLKKGLLQKLLSGEIRV